MERKRHRKTDGYTDTQVFRQEPDRQEKDRQDIHSTGAGREKEAPTHAHTHSHRERVSSLEIHTDRKSWVF